MSALSERWEPTADLPIREAAIGQLDGRFVHSVAALRGGGRFAIDGDPEDFAALVVEDLPTEFGGFGDPVLIADLMARLTGWGCVEVNPDDAPGVARRLAEHVGLASHFYGSLHYELTSPAPRITVPAVRLLDRRDLPLMRAADPDLDLRDLEPLLDEQLIAGAIVDGRLVSRASCSARSRHYGDIGIVTLNAFRGMDYATAAAAALARRLSALQLIPVWSTGEANHASQRVAEKLGFTLAMRRTYVVISTRDPAV